MKKINSIISFNRNTFDIIFIKSRRNISVIVEDMINSNETRNRTFEL